MNSLIRLISSSRRSGGAFKERVGNRAVVGSFFIELAGVISIESPSGFCLFANEFISGPV